jgi:hypothetical protein
MAGRPEPYEPFGFDWYRYPEDCSRNQEETRRLEAEKRVQADKKRKREDRIATFFMPLMLFTSPYGVVALLVFVTALFVYPDWMNRLILWLGAGIVLFLGWVFNRK